MTAKILETQLVISASDKTKQAFAGVAKHAEELRASLGNLGNLGIGSEQFAAANREIKKQTALLRTERAAVREVRMAMLETDAAVARSGGVWKKFAKDAGIGQIAVGYGTMAAVKTAAGAGASFEHERALMAVAGMSPADIEKSTRAAWAATRDVPGVDVADALKVVRELRMVFGNTKEPIANLESVLRATSTLRVVAPGIEAGGESYALAKALELKGVSTDPARFNRLLGMMIQSEIASGGKVTGSEFFEFTKYARGAALDFSDQFYARIAPMLIQEMGGSSAGRGLASFEQALTGGKMTNRAATEFVRLGLVDPSGVIRTSTGAVKGIKPGALIDSALALQNPYAWMQKYLPAALAAHGITDPSAISEELAHLFSNTYALQVAKLLLTQKTRVKKEIALQESAAGPGAIDQLRHTDPGAAWHAFGAEFVNLLTTIAGPLVPEAVAGMNAAEDMIRSLAEASRELQEYAPKTSAVVDEMIAALGGLAAVKAAQGTASMFGMDAVAAAIGTAASVALPVALAGVVLSVAVMNWPTITKWVNEGGQYVGSFGWAKEFLNWLDAHPWFGASDDAGTGPVAPGATPTVALRGGAGRHGASDDAGTLTGEAKINLHITLDHDGVNVGSHIDNGISGITIGTTGDTGMSWPDLNALARQSP